MKNRATQKGYINERRIGTHEFDSKHLLEFSPSDTAMSSKPSILNSKL